MKIPINSVSGLAGLLRDLQLLRSFAKGASGGAAVKKKVAAMSSREAFDLHCACFRVTRVFFLPLADADVSLNLEFQVQIGETSQVAPD